MASRSRIKYILAFVLVLIPVILVSACSQFDGSFVPTPTQEGTYPVDPLFLEFYRSLGGQETLGPAITPLFARESLRAQYTANALLIFDTHLPRARSYSLFPLGLHIGVSDPHVAPPPPEDTATRFVDGHVIFPEFVSLYDRLGGARFVGRPLTELRYNPEKQRLEQYFENLGFFRADRQALGQVRLLSYGAFVCDAHCRFSSFQDAIPTRQGTVPEPFATALARLGPAFVGRAISEVYLATDGLPEIIFDNLVLYAASQPTARIYARPIVQLLGYQAHPTVPRMEDNRMDFFPIQGELGHNIPHVFSDYLSRHGGFDIAGPPITEIFTVKDKNLYRQCFTNLCLDYHTDAPEGLHIRPTPLGMNYKAEFYRKIATEDFSALQSLRTLTLKVWDRRPILDSKESQTIHVAIFEGQNPLPDLEPVLTVKFPDGRLQIYHFSPTDAQGQSSQMIPPIQAPNGTLIPYQVCLTDLDGQQSCIQESYLIWGNP